MAAGLLGQCLPVECELGEYPLALLCGVYDANDPAAMSMEFFLELEVRETKWTKCSILDNTYVNYKMVV